MWCAISTRHLKRNNITNLHLVPSLYQTFSSMHEKLTSAERKIELKGLKEKGWKDLLPERDAISKSFIFKDFSEGVFI